jgi:transposase-like protein
MAPKSSIWRMAKRDGWNTAGRNRHLKLVRNTPEQAETSSVPEPIKDIDKVKVRPSRRAGHKIGAKWSDEDKVRALESYLEHGSSLIAAKETGIPDSTIRDWKSNDPIWQRHVQHSHDAIKQIFEANSQAISSRMVSLLLSTRDAATINAANNTLKAMVHNSALLAGDPTERTEHVTREEARKSLQRELGLGTLLSEGDTETVSAEVHSGPIEA